MVNITNLLIPTKTIGEYVQDNINCYNKYCSFYFVLKHKKKYYDDMLKYMTKSYSTLDEYQFVFKNYEKTLNVNFDNVLEFLDNE